MRKGTSAVVFHVGACFQDLNGYDPRVCKDINRGCQLVGCRAIQEQVVRGCDLWTEYQLQSMVDQGRRITAIVFSLGCQLA